MNYSQTWLAGGRFADDHRHSLILSDNSYQRQRMKVSMSILAF